MITVEKDCGSAVLAGESLDARMRDCSSVVLVWRRYGELGLRRCTLEVDCLVFIISLATQMSIRREFKC